MELDQLYPQFQNAVGTLLLQRRTTSMTLYLLNFIISLIESLVKDLINLL